MFNFYSNKYLLNLKTSFPALLNFYTNKIPKMKLSSISLRMTIISILLFLFYLNTKCQSVRTEVAGIPINYDEAKVPEYALPDLLTLANGEKVTNAEIWVLLTCDLTPTILRSAITEYNAGLFSAYIHHEALLCFRTFRQPTNRNH